MLFISCYCSSRKFAGIRVSVYLVQSAPYRFKFKWSRVETNAIAGGNLELNQLEDQHGEDIEINEDTQASVSIMSNASTASLPQEQENERSNNGHLHIQWLLAKIGHKLGCNIWIAANDQNKVWKGERLGDLSLKTLPALGMRYKSQQIVGLIDVLWLRGLNAVVAAFEVEHTTSIYSGILRMSISLLCRLISIFRSILSHLKFVLTKYVESFHDPRFKH